MTDTATHEAAPEAPADVAALPYPQIVNLNVKGEIVRAGHKLYDVCKPEALGLSDGAAARRFGNKLDWPLKELWDISVWLGIPVERLTTRDQT